MRFNYVFGVEDRFELDVRYSTWGLDEQALLELKEKPGRVLNGRVYKMALRETCGRTISARRDRRLAELAASDVILDYDEEPDVISEREAEKALRRKHRAVARFYQVRKPDYNAGWNLKSHRKAANRCSRQNLNKLAVIVEKDFVGKHGSLFADEGGWSVHGSRNLDVRR